MRMLGRSSSRFFAIIPLMLAGLAGAQTFYWNPSAPLLSSGSGEAQKAYNWSSDPAGGGTYPKSAFDDDFSATSLGSAWTTRDADAFTDTPRDPYISLTDITGKLLLRARGADIWHDTNQFVAVYRSDIQGDFDVSVKVDSLFNSHSWAKAGIMMRNGFTGADSAGYAIIAVTPGNGVAFQCDITGNLGELDYSAQTGSGSLTKPSAWLRLVKRGTSVSGYYKTSLTATWTQVGTTQTAQSAKANSQIGLFVSSHSAGTSTTAVFEDFTGGGPLTSTALDLNLGGGTGATADSAARLTGPLSAKSLVIKGSKVAFDFQTSTLTVSDSAIFTGAKLVTPGTGSIAFTGNGPQKLAPLAGSPLPAISKTVPGTLTLAGSSLTAGLLTLGAGILNCGNMNQEFAGLNATAGSITGLDAADTLTFSGDANFSGLTALPAAGAVMLRATSGTLDFTPPTAPAAAFSNLILWPRPAASISPIIAMHAGTLNLAGSLILRDEKFSGTVGDGIVDFRTGNSNVTLGGSVSRADFGSGTANKLRLYMGKGIWAIKGDLNVNPSNGLTADSATLDFQANTPTVQNITAGAWTLGAIKHTGTGTLNLVQAGVALTAASFSQTAGALNLNGSNLQTTDSLIVRNGTPGSFIGLGGRLLKSGGKIFLSGSSAARLGLNPGSAWTVTAAGTLNADSADIGGSDASGGSAGTATAACTDVGGNAHWNFPPTAPSFTLQPASKEVVAGLPVVFKAKAAGTAPIAYAWHKQGDTTTLSIQDSLYFAKADAAQNGFHYYCTASNSVGSVPSLDAILTVDVPPVIDAQPADTVIVAGKPASFTVTAHGSGTLAYVWTKVGDAATVLSRTATLSLDSGAARKNDGAAFTCSISNGFGSAAVTRAALLTVKYPPAIARQPADLIATLGQKATLSIGATGTGPLAFAWTVAGDTAVLSTDSLLTVGPLALADSNSYQCRVTNAYGSVVSRTAKLGVVQAATIVREPADMTVGPGRKAYFIAGVAGAQPLTYAWRRKGSATVIGMDTLLVIDTAKLSDNGAIFVFTVSNAYGADTSREAKLSVVACDSVFKVTPETLTVDEGQPVKLAGTAACASGRQWTVESGPGPRILDPEIDTLAFVAPRVTADTVIVLRFTAQYFNGSVYKEARIKVREAIPDPKFTLPAPGKWKGTKTYVVRPTLTNSADLKASKYSPPLHYLWSLSAPAADTAQGGDSLKLSNPIQGGNLDVTLCMDNGGASLCAVHTVEIDLLSVSLALRAAHFGPVSLSGRMLAWNSDAAVRIWDFRGRILWQGRRQAGASAMLPESAARDLFRGRARLEIHR